MPATFDGVEYHLSEPPPHNAEESIQFLLCRIIAGKIKLKKGKSVVLQPFDYSELPHIRQSRKPANVIPALLLSEGVEVDVTDFIKNTRGDNREFFREILSEFSNFFIQTNRGNHTTAFLHIYRILERSSYSVPLLYSKTQKDFLETFKFLKELLNDNAGELVFLNRFLTKTRFIDSLILDAVFEIQIDSEHGHKDSYFDLADRLFKEFEFIDRTNFKFGIKFKNIQNLIINLRNRTFHAATGDWQKNAKMQELIETDEFFKCFNQVFINFLSIVIIRIVSVIYKKN